MGAIAKDSMAANRHHARSVPCGAVAEIFADQPVAHVIGMVVELSRLGCFVRIRVPVPDGTKVRLKLTHGEDEFETSGEVSYLLPEKGVGIKFTEASPGYGAGQDAWLDDTNG